MAAGGLEGLRSAFADVLNIMQQASMSHAICSTYSAFLSNQPCFAQIAVCRGQHGSRRTSTSRLPHLQICVAAGEDSVPKPSSAQQRFVTALQVRVPPCIYCSVPAGADFQSAAGLRA